jgi:hypothetical protein
MVCGQNMYSISSLHLLLRSENPNQIFVTYPSQQYFYPATEQMSGRAQLYEVRDLQNQYFKRTNRPWMNRLRTRCLGTQASRH